MAGRPIVGLVSFLFLGAAILFQFFVILSGAVGGNPEPHFYYLAADTSGIGNAPAASAWTFFDVCSISSISGTATTYGCMGAHAALPFSPPENFGTTTNVPSDFIGNHYYYYLSRFTFAFYLIALFFAVISLLLSGLALCTRLGAYATGFLTGVALFFQCLASALLTTFVVKGRNAFMRDGRDAAIGRYTMGFTWGTVAALFISMILYCVGGAIGKERKYDAKKSRWNSFGRKRSTRSRGSFGAAAGTAGSTSDANGVKEEYA